MYLALYLISAATLLLQVVLIRVFSIWLWNHYAFFVISLALLGFGASGSYLHLAGPRRVLSLRAVFVLFFISSATVYFGITRIPFDPLRWGWDSWQLFWISALYLFAALPFFFGGLFVVLCLRRDPTATPRLYAVNLVGSAFGALVSLWLLQLPLPGLKMIPYKALPQALQYPEARIVETRWGPMARVDLVQSGAIRYAPGLSLRFHGRLPDQLGISMDGDRLNAVTRWEKKGLEFLNFLPSAAPYALLSAPEVLVLEGGGGLGVLEAVANGSRRIDVLEPNPDVVALVEGSGFSGGIYREARVRVFQENPRRYLRGSQALYDLIASPLPDLGAAGSTGLYGLNEDYLHTVEAFEEDLDHLREGGIFTLTRPLLVPPRELPRIAGIAAASLRSRGAEIPSDHILFIESWGTWTMILKKTPLTFRDRAVLQQFVDNRDFRLLSWEEATESLRDAENPFDLSPTTDYRPFFQHFFRLSKIGPALRSLEGKWEAFLEGGYLVYGALGLSVFWGCLLLLIPALAKREGRRGWRAPVILYFFLIGLGFLFVEMALLQRTIFIFGNPTYGLAVLLSFLLLLAGLGSLAASRLEGRPVLVFFGIAAGLLIQGGLRSPELSLLVAAPVVFLMGIPFPAALRRLTQEVPMAWAANGVASVIGASLAVATALEWGYGAVMLAAAVFYLLAGVIFLLLPSWERIGRR